ncbi:MAG: LysM peptidoglycan-binding domain-containing protein, partial [Burkholderiales bacterium]|nr:LysM peptidoglycan-binding domain-containing protein [Burkholderiales bacterium]
VRDDVSERLADTAALNLAPDAPPLRRVSFKAGKADTVAGIAARYKVRSEQVAQWNKVGSGARFKPGQAVVVYTAFKAAPPARSTAVAKQAPKGKGGKSRNVVASAAP